MPYTLVPDFVFGVLQGGIASIKYGHDRGHAVGLLAVRAGSMYFTFVLVVTCRWWLTFHPDDGFQTLGLRSVRACNKKNAEPSFLETLNPDAPPTLSQL